MLALGNRCSVASRSDRPIQTLVGFEAAGNIVEPLRQATQHRRDTAFDRFKGRPARRLLGAQNGIARSAQLVTGLGQLIGDQQRHHDQKTRLADYADGAIELGSALVEIGRQTDDMLLLPIVAGDWVGAAADCDGDLTHDQPLTSERTSAIA